MSEDWRTIQHHPLYEVSDFGHVRSFARRGRPPYCTLPAQYPHLPRPSFSGGGGYPRVIITGGLCIPVHRLVLEAFVGPCPTGMEACHNDGNPTNAALSNLRWDTHRNNILDRQTHGTARQQPRITCQRGHGDWFTAKDGRRRCRLCRNARARRNSSEESLQYLEAAL